MTSLTARLEIESPDEQAALLNGAKVSAAQISPCAMEVSVGESTHVVTYSYPINGPSSRVRIARKSHYIEVCELLTIVYQKLTIVFCGRL